MFFQYHGKIEKLVGGNGTNIQNRSIEIGKAREENIEHEKTQFIIFTTLAFGNSKSSTVQVPEKNL